MTHKIQFIRIMDADSDHQRASLHDAVPLLQTHDILLRLEYGNDGKPLNCVHVTCEGQKFEPSFTLRGQDPLSSQLVDLWASFAEASGCNAEKIISAKSTAEAMRQWPDKHIPD
tara:strand:+ start:1306 stop:1647 length:342 start_codon:yes stop_codon:yes gene_type:complete